MQWVVFVLVALVAAFASGVEHTYRAELEELLDPDTGRNFARSLMEATRVSTLVTGLRDEVQAFNMTDVVTTNQFISRIAKTLQLAVNAYGNSSPGGQGVALDLYKDVLDVIDAFETRTGTQLYANETAVAHKEEPGIYTLVRDLPYRAHD